MELQQKIDRITDILRRDDGISGAMHYTEQISWILFLKFLNDFEEEKEDILKNFKSDTKVSIQRYKGLGEMNPEQLWETTMDPNQRILLQVKIEDAVEADRTFDILMGKEVAPRKKFIQTSAKSVKHLDV